MLLEADIGTLVPPPFKVRRFPHPHRLSVTTNYLSPGPSNGAKQPRMETSEVRARINLGVVADEHLPICLSVWFCLFAQWVAALGDGMQGRVHAKQPELHPLSLKPLENELM